MAEGPEAGFAIAASTSGPAPGRLPWSIRRTSTIDSNWPDHLDGPVRVSGRARDLLTRGTGEDMQVLGEDWFEIVASPRREIRAISSNRHQDRLQALVGERAASGYRGKIAALLPEEKGRASCLHLVLDDFAGASLVFNWVWTRWRPDAAEERRRSGSLPSGKAAVMTDICSGFRTGSSGLDENGTSRFDTQSAVLTDRPVYNVADARDWHEMPEQACVAMRRARWMDVSLAGHEIQVRSGFQDSGTDPGGDRAIIHEYRSEAVADRGTGSLTALVATAHVLPYRECTVAVTNIQRLLGRNLAHLREDVAGQLPGILGCTHLNDVLRNLADARPLAEQLASLSPV